MVQILHTCSGKYKHWITISTVRAPSDTVFVYNSIDENIPNSIIHDICSILFCQFQMLNIIAKPVQMQKVHQIAVYLLFLMPIVLLVGEIHQI